MSFIRAKIMNYLTMLILYLNFHHIKNSFRQTDYRKVITEFRLILFQITSEIGIQKTYWEFGIK